MLMALCTIGRPKRRRINCSSVTFIAHKKKYILITMSVANQYVAVNEKSRLIVTRCLLIDRLIDTINLPPRIARSFDTDTIIIRLDPANVPPVSDCAVKMINGIVARRNYKTIECAGNSKNRASRLY